MFQKSSLSKEFWIWSKLESQIRSWALEYGGLYVASGGIFKSKLGAIGIYSVTIPASYYKVVYSNKNGMIAFILSNEGSSKDLSQFVVSVDSVESVTGIDFFSGLDDKTENKLEAEISPPSWGF